MERKMYNLFSLSLDFSLLSVIIRLFAAALMGGLIGSERGRHGRAAGLRTHILVCVGAAMTSLTSMYLTEALGFNGDVARISAQVISGIGFLGAGTILIRNSSVITGLTTAAGMWATAAIGVAVGYGFYSGALVATLIGIFSVTVLSRLEKKKKNNISVYVEVRDITEVEFILKILKTLDEALISYDIIPPKSGYTGNVGITCILNGEKHFKEIENSISSHGGVVIIASDINT